jgi:hypothetical protein
MKLIREVVTRSIYGFPVLFQNQPKNKKAFRPENKTPEALPGGAAALLE